MLFPGFFGIAVGVVLLLAMWLIASLNTKGSVFDFDPMGEKGAFEKLLTIYLDVAKLMIGLASGSIVLLVGSSALHSAQHSPDSFASPLFLLALSIVYGILFMVFLILNYEQYRHRHNSYTRFKYTRNQAFGFAGLSCFCVGYGWLIVNVTK